MTDARQAARAPSPYDPAETLDPDVRRALQLDRLKDLVERASSAVPFYRDRFREAGIAAGDVHGLDVLAELPFTVKDDLRDHYPFGLLAEPLDRVVRVHASSGTTGKPTVVAYTRADVELWAHLMARTMAAGGVGPADVVQNAYGYGLFTGGLGIHYGAEALGAAVIPMSGGNTPRQLMLMQDFGSTVLGCTPSYALSMVESAEASGVSIGDLSLRVGFFGAEPWSEHMRRAIEERWGIRALDLYGLSEVIGPGVAHECLVQDGLHIAEDHFLPEVVDPESGSPLPEGELGELVFTCVTKEALPLIRYRTRDLTRLHRGTCDCGRTTGRMERVTGRDDDMLIVRGVNVFPSQIETVILGIDGAEPHYQILVDRGERHLDTLEVRIEAHPDVWGDPDRRVDLNDRLRVGIESALGISCTIRVAGPNEVPRSEGKAARVVDKRTI